MNTRARGLLLRQLAWILGFLWSGGLAGCGDGCNRMEQSGNMSTDITELKRFINLPGEVNSGEWQTGKFARSGGDWWVAALLEIGADEMPTFLQGAGRKELFETPPGLKLDSSFAALKSIPEAQITESQGIRAIAETYSTDPYVSSPLLNGRVIKLSESEILVLLWTN